MITWGIMITLVKNIHGSKAETNEYLRLETKTFH